MSQARVGTGAPALTCSDIITAYARACELAGQGPARAVIRRFGAQYAARVEPRHYAAVMEGLAALIRSTSAVGQRPESCSPAMVRGRWAKAE